MTYELKDWLNSINSNKKDLTAETPESIKSYPAFIVNKCLSGDLDSLFFANEMNIHHQLDHDMQYQFYLNSLRKRKRFSPWIKKESIENLEYIKRYYNYNNDKALSVLNILTTQQINFIKNKLDIGGLK